MFSCSRLQRRQRQVAISVASNASAACFNTTHVQLDILTIRGRFSAWWPCRARRAAGHRGGVRLWRFPASRPGCSTGRCKRLKRPKSRFGEIAKKKTVKSGKLNFLSSKRGGGNAGGDCHAAAIVVSMPLPGASRHQCNAPELRRLTAAGAFAFPTSRRAAVPPRRRERRHAVSIGTRGPTLSASLSARSAASAEERRGTGWQFCRTAAVLPAPPGTAPARLPCRGHVLSAPGPIRRVPST